MPTTSRASAAPRTAIDAGLRQWTRGCILVLSGFLAGLASASLVKPGTELIVYAAAAAGMLAYLAFGHLARVRRQRDNQAVLGQRVARMAHRIDRHIPRGAAVRSPRSATRSYDFERQFLTVPVRR